MLVVKDLSIREKLVYPGRFNLKPLCVMLAARIVVDVVWADAGDPMDRSGLRRTQERVQQTCHLRPWLVLRPSPPGAR